MRCPRRSGRLALQSEYNMHQFRTYQTKCQKIYSIEQTANWKQRIDLRSKRMKVHKTIFFVGRCLNATNGRFPSVSEVSRQFRTHQTNCKNVQTNQTTANCTNKLISVVEYVKESRTIPELTVLGKDLCRRWTGCAEAMLT